jgi:hypothetical protein
MTDIHMEIEANKNEQYHQCLQCGDHLRTTVRRTRWQLIISVGICSCDGNRVLHVTDVIPTEKDSNHD